MDQPTIEQEAAKAPAFNDIAGTEHQAAIQWLADEGLTKGYPDGTYRPLWSVNGEAVAAFMYRLAGEPPTHRQPLPFSDVPPSTQFYEEITWLTSKGISTGWTEGDGSKEAPVRRRTGAAL